MTEFQHPAEQGSTAKDFLNGHSSFPMYQYSVFLNDGRDEQLVVRAATFAELLEGKRNLNKILNKVNNNDSVQETENQEVCSHTNYKTLVVKKDSPNKGRQFKSCIDCGKFLGFV